MTSGPKPGLVRDLGATYHAGSLADAAAGAAVVLECTGVGEVVFGAMDAIGPNGIVCLVGTSSDSKKIDVDATGLNRKMVMKNGVVIGSVNANRRHYEAAAESLTRADREWLDRIITRRVPLGRYAEA